MNPYIVPCILISILLGVLIYLLITMKTDHAYKVKLRKIQSMINEGHEKALSGRKNDGIYQETKRLREEYNA